MSWFIVNWAIPIGLVAILWQVGKRMGPAPRRAGGPVGSTAGLTNG
jgi:hypothetical protein